MYRNFFIYLFVFLFSWSASAQIANPAPYCSADFHNADTNIDYRFTNVTLGSLTNPSGNGDYIFFNAEVIPDLIQGVVDSLLLTVVGTQDIDGVGAWIDYNQNGTFEDSERIMNDYKGTAGALFGLRKAFFMVPYDALPGNTRMRVRVIRDPLYYDVNGETDMLPCNSPFEYTLPSGVGVNMFQWGETEDYMVNIQTSCFNPDNRVIFQYQGKDYEIIKEKRNWEDAANCALERDGNLAEIRTQDEQDSVFLQLQNNTLVDSSALIWIGGNDRITDGEWIWDGNLDGVGDQFWMGDFTGTPVGGEFNNWASVAGVLTEPTADGLEMNSMAMRMTAWPGGSAGQWVDHHEDSLFYYVIEREPLVFDYNDTIPYIDTAFTMIQTTGDTLVDLCTGDAETVVFDFDLHSALTVPVQLEITGVPLTGLIFNQSATSFTANGQLSLEFVNASLPFGEYEVTITAKTDNPVYQITKTLTVRSYVAIPNFTILTEPANGAINLSPIAPTLKWQPNDYAATFNLRIASDAAMTNILHTEGGIFEDEVQPSFSFAINTTYYWQIRAENPCGEASFWSDVFSFTTVPTNDIPGCTDQTALNYNPNATLLDASCEYPIEGCMDATALNYNPDAVVSDTCIFFPAVIVATPINDSTFDLSINAATPQIGTIYTVNWHFNDGTPNVYGFTTTKTFNQNGVYTINAHVYTSTQPIYNIQKTIEIDIWGCTDIYASNFSPKAKHNDGSCVPYIYGCTDSTAFNYNPAANSDNGTCIAKVFGCMDTNAFNYNPAANTADTCIAKVFGCIDSTAFNYNTNANTDDGSCIPVVLGCMDPAAFNYNPNANTADSCIAKEFGCINPIATNYDSTANTDDGSCTFTEPGDDFWQVTTTSENHTILIATDIDVSAMSLPLDSGDYLGVFYTKNSGEVQCAGKVRWDSVNTTISAFQNESPFDNGFDVGETFQWKIWKLNDNTTHDLVINYDTTFSHQGEFDIDGLSKVETIQSGSTQTVDLSAGWNFISLNIVPDQPSIDSVFSRITNHVFLAKDENGDVFWPSVGINNIGNHTMGEGYKVRMHNDTILNVTGVLADPTDYSINLPLGWSYLGYLRNADANAENVMESVEGALWIMKNQAGQVYWPTFGINQIGNMKVGEGYQIRMNQDTTFTFPSNELSLPSLKWTGEENPTYFTDVLTSTRHMHIAFSKSVWNTMLNSGDEIGVFYENNLIGASVISDDVTVVTIFGSEDKKWDNKPLVLKIRDSKTGEISEFSIDNKKTTFIENEAYLAKKINQEIEIFTVNGEREIEFLVSDNKAFQIEIIDALGRIVYKGKTSDKVWTIPAQIVKGVYSIKVTSDKGITQKTILSN